jgi:hypothetical protein
MSRTIAFIAAKTPSKATLLLSNIFELPRLQMLCPVGDGGCKFEVVCSHDYFNAAFGNLEDSVD